MDGRGEAYWAELQRSTPDDAAARRRAIAEWESTHPEPAVTVADVANQVEHVARIAGDDHVGIGSDFNGMSRYVIADLRDSSKMPALFEELLRRGWTKRNSRSWRAETSCACGNPLKPAANTN
ncbi:MAG: membrane dipeptidase [Hymenobacter sp.]